MNPKKSSHFAKALGNRSKTDPIDAKTLYTFSKVVDPKDILVPQIDHVREELSLYLSSYEFVIKTQTAIANRIEALSHHLGGPRTTGRSRVTRHGEGISKVRTVYLPFAFGLAALISGIKSFRQKKLYARTESRSDVASLNEMSWQDFERLVGEYYRRKDFLVTHTGGDGPDGGIDLVLRKDKELYLVQCKQWKAYKVGVKPVGKILRGDVKTRCSRWILRYFRCFL